MSSTDGVKYVTTIPLQLTPVRKDTLQVRTRNWDSIREPTLSTRFLLATRIVLSVGLIYPHVVNRSNLQRSTMVVLLKVPITLNQDLQPLRRY